MAGTIAWIETLNETRYLGVTGWTLPLASDFVSLWTQLTNAYSPNPSGDGVLCSTLNPTLYPGCGYYDANVGPFLFVEPSFWTGDYVGAGKAAWVNVAASIPKGAADASALKGSGSADTIVPGYLGQNQQSAPHTSSENYSEAVAVIRCNIFNVPVSGKPKNYGSCGGRQH